MAYPSLMFIVLTALLIGTAIAQSPSKTRPHLAPAPSSGGNLAPSQFAFAPPPSFGIATPSPASSPSHGPRPFPPAKSPSPHAVSPAPGSGIPAPRSSIAVPPTVQAPAPAPMSGAVSNRLALGTLAVGLLVVSLVA